jgi:hypothetical protein
MVKPFAVLVLLSFFALAACGSEGAGNRTVATNGDVAQRLDSAAVPVDLRHLVPLAERWGIGDDVDRNDRVRSATAAEREELQSAITPLYARITAWLDSFGGGAMSDEAAAFMYMQLALEEMLAATSS